MCVELKIKKKPESNNSYNFNQRYSFNEDIHVFDNDNKRWNTLSNFRLDNVDVSPAVHAVNSLIESQLGSLPVILIYVSIVHFRSSSSQQ